MIHSRRSEVVQALRAVAGLAALLSLAFALTFATKVCLGLSESGSLGVAILVTMLVPAVVTRLPLHRRS